MINAGANYLAGGDWSKGALLMGDASSGDELIVTTGVTSIPVAVALNDVDVSVDGADAGEYAVLEHGKMYTLIGSSTGSLGDPIAPTASGAAVVATSTQRGWFIARQAFTDGQLFLATFVGPTIVA